jgi:phosphoinositide-3-kinase, regulatory subunit 4
MKQLDLQEDGCAVDISYLDSGSQMVLVYATVYGSLIGWDLRAPKLAWKVNNDIKQGKFKVILNNKYILKSSCYQ